MVTQKSEMGILRTERSIVRAMCGVRLKDRNRNTDLMLMLGVSETTDLLAMANNVCWYGCLHGLLAWSCIQERGWPCP